MNSEGKYSLSKDWISTCWRRYYEFGKIYLFFPFTHKSDNKHQMNLQNAKIRLKATKENTV